MYYNVEVRINSKSVYGELFAKSSLHYMVVYSKELQD